MIISAQTRAKLDELRVIGLARYSAMKSAEKAYTDAMERRKAAFEYAAGHGEFYTFEKKRVTGESNAFLMSDADFAENFCPLVAQGYKELFGLEYPVGYCPTFEFLDPLKNARKAYRRIAADYLRILGLTEHAEKIERAMDSYFPPELMAELDQINAEWLGISDTQ